VAKDDRLRSPLKADYVDALGRAAYTFANCEWQVVWSCEKISPGALQNIVSDELTAGMIAKKFTDLCRNMPKSDEREALEKIAKQFTALVKIRNRILHGKPCTGPNGEARLSGPGVIEIPELEEAADEFTQCSVELNDLFYGFLQTYTPA
jgi:hypothetical protein